MPSLLIPYEGSSNKLKDKFIRAVDSVLNQTYKNFELVIISDGCKDTVNICKRRWQKEMAKGIIVLVEIPEKTPRELFVGNVRQTGINKATGDVLCNLDADDYILPTHFHNLNAGFDTNKFEWVYFNLYRKLDILKNVEEIIDTQPNTDSLCTASVSWRKDLPVTWNFCDGRNDNKGFNAQLIEAFPKRSKIYGLGYVICHANISYIGS